MNLTRPGSGWSPWPRACRTSTLRRELLVAGAKSRDLGAAAGSVREVNKEAVRYGVRAEGCRERRQGMARFARAEGTIDTFRSRGREIGFGPDGRACGLVESQVRLGQMGPRAEEINALAERGHRAATALLDVDTGAFIRTGYTLESSIETVCPRREWGKRLGRFGAVNQVALRAGMVAAGRAQEHKTAIWIANATRG